MNNANSRVRGLLATLALIAFVIGVPVVLIGIHAIPDFSSFSWSRLTAQDDGTRGPAGHRRRLLDRVGGVHLPTRCLDRVAGSWASARRVYPGWPFRSWPPTAWSRPLRCCSSQSRP